MSRGGTTTITARDLAREGRRGGTGGPVLEVQDLVMHYRTKQGDVSAVEGLSFTLNEGEALGLVGESGCGKTSVALSLLGLLPENAIIQSGKILLDGKDLVPLTESEMRKHRWFDVSMVFQGAMNAWNPVYRVGDQIHEALRTHYPGISKSESRKRIVDLFDLVGLQPAMMDRYPHEFSGGMRQRAIIAMALSCNPRVIIADEPTTALDVIVQDRILKQLKQIQKDLGMAIVYISHDIAVIAEVSDRIGVMYAGKLVELGSTDQVFARPRHPYSWLLLSSTPSILGPRRKLAALMGEPPNLLQPPPACRFHPRCPFATARCSEEEPPLNTYTGPAHEAACWHWDRVPAVGEETAS
jgi:peptide/nickel transport system ATP-binding protein